MTAVPLLAFLCSGLGAAAAVNTSPTACSGCHPAETQLHSQSRMATAMLPVSTTAFANHLPEQPLKESGDGFSLQFKLQGDRVLVLATRAAVHDQGTIDWVLGSGAQGQTPLVRTESGELLESRVSYFTRLNRFGITIGQNAGASPTAQSALGFKFNDHDTKQCIGCHVTAVTKDFEPLTPGVQCIRCHPGADEHVANVHKLPDNPGRMSASRQVRFCGTCHRSRPPVDEFQLENVRFQPLRLSKSSCFRGDQLACTTCHPAHQNARRADAAFYNSKCVTCHAGTAPHHDVQGDKRASGNCIGCHMPYVELHPGLHFTDHFIRVVKAGDLPRGTLRVRDDGALASKSTEDEEIGKIAR